MLKPLKTVTGKRMAYLVSLAKIYEEEGYKTKLDGFKGTLEIYPKGNIAEVNNNETSKTS